GSGQQAASQSAVNRSGRSARLDDLDGEVGVAARAVGPWATLAAKTQPCAGSNAGRDRDLHLLGSRPRVERDAPLAAQLSRPSGERQPQGHVLGRGVGRRRSDLAWRRKQAPANRYERGKKPPRPTRNRACLIAAYRLG